MTWCSLEENITSFQHPQQLPLPRDNLHADNKQDLFSGLVVAVHALSYPQPRHPLQSHLATDTPRYEEQSPGKDFTNKNHHGCPPA